MSEVSELPGVLVVLPGVLFDVPHADNNVNVIKHARINAVILIDAFRFPPIFKNIYNSTVQCTISTEYCLEFN